MYNMCMHMHIPVACVHVHVHTWGTSGAHVGLYESGGTPFVNMHICVGSYMCVCGIACIGV